MGTMVGVAPHSQALLFTSFSDLDSDRQTDRQTVPSMTDGSSVLTVTRMASVTYLSLPHINFHWTQNAAADSTEIALGPPSSTQLKAEERIPKSRAASC